MKKARCFKGSMFFLAVLAAIAVAEIVAWQVAAATGLRVSPVTVACAAAGLVAMAASVLYEGADVD